MGLGKMRSIIFKMWFFSIILLLPSLTVMFVPAALSADDCERFVNQPNSENPLFSSRQVSESTSYGSSEAAGTDAPVLRSRLAQVNFNAVFSESAGNDRSVKPAAKIDLNLFEGARYIAVAQRVSFLPNGGLVWEGVVEEVPLSSVSLAVLGDALEGHISLGYATFTIQHMAEGLCKISEVEVEQFPPGAASLPPGVPEEKSLKDHRSPSKAFRPMSDDGSMIDVLVAYTAAARAARGGTEGIISLINLAIAKSNTSYENSGVSQRLNLAATYEVDYVETGSLNTDIYRLQRVSDGYMDDVHAVRDAYCADAVVLIVDNGGSYCGLSFQMIDVSSPFNSYMAFAVVADECAIGNLAFPHELGHVMGAMHDRDHMVGPGAFDYSYGYVAPDFSFRTIMSYPTGGAPLVPYWSNPDIDYGGLPMGIAGETDNRMTLNNTAAVVANFRQSCTAAPPSADFTADMTSGLRPLLVTFTNASSGDVSSYYWEFGDGGSSTEANPVSTSIRKPEPTRFRSQWTVQTDRIRCYRNDYIQVYELHDADTDEPAGSIDGNEVSRLLAYWRDGAYHCEGTGMDGYAPGAGDSTCVRHCADYQEPYWALDGSETNRVLAYWRAGGYHADETGVDGYAPGSQATPQSDSVIGSSQSSLDAGHSVDTGTYQPGGLVTVSTRIRVTPVACFRSCGVRFCPRAGKSSR